MSCQDEQSNFDSTTLYGRKTTINGSKHKKAVSYYNMSQTGGVSSPHNEAQRMTKKDLVPPRN